MRPRVRRLPEPPQVTNDLEVNTKPKADLISVASAETEEQFANILEEKIEQIEISSKEREEFLAARRNLLDELDGIFRQGFDSTLVH